jgi:cytochrome c
MLIRLICILIPVSFLFACAQENSSSAEAVAESAAADAAPTVGDPETGKRFYIFCQACHTINAGGINKVGPNLHGIMGSTAAQAEGFIYSDALAAADITWDEATIDRWITRPSATVPGTTMVFAGINDPQQRLDLIAYLKQASSE